MVLAVREQVLAVFKARMDGVAGFTKFRNPKRPVMPDQMPAYAMWDGGQLSQVLETGSHQWRMGVTVEIYDKTDDDGQALNEAYAKLVEAIMPPLGGGHYDVTLGGLAVFVRETEIGDPVTVNDEGRATYRVMPVEFAIDFWTAENDPRTLGPD